MFSSGFDVVQAAFDEGQSIERSPRIEGAIQGAKAALMAAPVGAAISALKGKNPYLGALVAGVGAGILVGGAAAANKKIDNMNQQAILKYHIRRIAEEDPHAIVPKGIVARPSMPFARGMENVYYQNQY